MSIKIRPVALLPAIQWTGENRAEIAAWLQEHSPSYPALTSGDFTVDEEQRLDIPVYPYDWADPGDWLLLHYGPTIEAVPAKQIAQMGTTEAGDQS